MLDDFRNPMKDSSSQDHQDLNHAGSSQKKIAVVLTIAALGLAASLFFSSPSDENPTQSSDADARLAALATRIETLEMLLKQPNASQSHSFIALTTSDEANQLPQDEEPDTKPKTEKTKFDSTESLQALIAQELANTPTIQQPTEPPVVAEPATPKKQTTAVKQVTTQKTAAKSYTVQRGDTLSTISQKMYGTSKRWKDIADANKNKITHDNQVRVGSVLTIP